MFRHVLGLRATGCFVLLLILHHQIRICQGCKLCTGEKHLSKHVVHQPAHVKLKAYELIKCSRDLKTHAHIQLINGEIYYFLYWFSVFCRSSDLNLKKANPYFFQKLLPSKKFKYREVKFYFGGNRLKIWDADICYRVKDFKTK